MADALKSEPSEFVAGESDPTEFTGDAVAEYLKSADEDEVNRIVAADERKGVQNAADTRLENLAADEPDEEDEGSDEEEATDDTDSDSGDSATEKEEAEKPSEGEPTPVKSSDLPDPKDDNYDANMDPAVPSSVVAENIMRELKGLGKSPTLDECRKEYEKYQQNQ